MPFIDDGHVLLRMFCREQAGSLDQSIRYGVAVTIEADEGIPVYQESSGKARRPFTNASPLEVGATRGGQVSLFNTKEER